MLLRNKLLIVATASSLSVCVMATENSLSEIDSLTKQWLDTERSATQLHSDWQFEQSMLEQRISLLKRQNEQLQETIERANATSDDLTERRQELLVSQTKLEKQLNEYEQVKPQVVHLLQQAIASAPPYLQQQLNLGLEELSDKKQLTTEYQLITDLLVQLRKNSELIQVKQGVIDLSQQSLMSEQLYLGNSQAWFVTADNSRAGIGLATSEGWQWQEMSEHADVIRLAIRRSKNLTPGDLLLLPVQLEANP